MSVMIDPGRTKLGQGRMGMSLILRQGVVIHEEFQTTLECLLGHKNTGFLEFPKGRRDRTLGLVTF